MTTMTEDQLIHDIVMLEDTFASVKEQLERKQDSLRKMMEANGATAIAHPEYKVRLETKDEWDTTLGGPLHLLGELIGHELGKAIIPETTKVTPAKYNMVKIKPMKSFGGKVAEIIEQARVPGAARLVIKRRK